MSNREKFDVAYGIALMTCTSFGLYLLGIERMKVVGGILLAIALMGFIAMHAESPVGESEKKKRKRDEA